MNFALPTSITLTASWLLPWHAALVVAALFLVAFGISRLQFNRAREDWANAFFYSPSSKTQQRHRRQMWQDRMWACLILFLTSMVTAGYLYVRQPV